MSDENEREIELERRFDNLKTALQEYVDYLEYITKMNTAPKKRKPSKCTINGFFVSPNVKGQK